MAQSIIVKEIPTTPFKDQKPGTSGLRKKTNIFAGGYYLHNFIQSTFNALPKENYEGQTLCVGGDGRYFSREATQIIAKIAAANGVGRLWIAKDCIISTPAMSAVIRTREEGVCKGAFILTASHNPGGVTADFGVKYNGENGAAAPQPVTDGIYAQSLKIDKLLMAELPELDVSTIGTKYEFLVNDKPFVVEIISGTEDYIALLKTVFDFDYINKLTTRKDFKFYFDAQHGVAGIYTIPIFHDLLHIPLEDLHNYVPKPDFNGWHPDPNLTYAKELVPAMGIDRKGNSVECDVTTLPDLGCATDGDADRCMVIGKQWFVSPSDSLAIVAANASAIPYFSKGIKGVARSMPTSSALDIVAKAQNIPLFEVPTGWKFFGNLMDSGLLGKVNYHPFICGEESFGLGADYIREKDGIFCSLCWLSIMTKYNEDASKPLVSIKEIFAQHVQKYGRHYYTRYDYEGLPTADADRVMSRLTGIIDTLKWSQLPHIEVNGFKLCKADDFAYYDTVDESTTEHQGYRFFLEDGSRIIFRLSGTGSSGATIRMYLEKYEKDEKKMFVKTQEVMKDLVDLALELSHIPTITGRKEPTVIT